MSSSKILTTLIFPLLLVFYSCSYSDDDDRYITPVSPGTELNENDSDVETSASALTDKTRDQSAAEGFMII